MTDEEEATMMSTIQLNRETERRECELVALRAMEQNQGTDAGKIAGEIAASIRARS